MIPLVNNPVAAGRSLSKVSRPQNVAYSGILASATAYVCGTGIRSALVLYLLIILLYALATIYNNTQDELTDRLNRRHDIVQPHTALLRPFMIICGGIVLLSQLTLVQPATLYLTFILVGLGIAYSHPRLRIMARGYWATLLLCLYYGVIPFLLGAVQTSVFSLKQCAVMALVQIGLLFPVILAKDYKDLAGDKATGKYTPLVKYGDRIVRLTATIVAAAGTALYSALAAQLAIPVWFYIPGSAAYVFLAWYLHYYGGLVSHHAKKLLTICMLLLSLSLLVAAT